MNKESELTEYLSHLKQINFLGFVDPPNQTHPINVWKYIATWTNNPILKIDYKEIHKASSKWWIIAEKINLLSSKKLLISIGAKNLGSLPWALISIEEKTDIIEHFSIINNSPDFICLSLDGQRSLGVTSEEYELWLFATKITKNEISNISINTKL